MTLYASVNLIDLWGNQHDIVPQGEGNSEVLKLLLAYGGEAKQFTFTLQDIDAATTGWLTKGCIVKFYVASTDPPDTLVLTAMVENILRSQKGHSSLRLTVSGREHQYIRALERVVIEAYEDRAPSDIVKSILLNYLPYPDNVRLACNFCENTGSIVADQSAHGNHGTITGGGTWEAGKYNYAVKLDGSNDFINFGTSETLHPDSFTVAFWYRQSSHTSSYQGVVGNRNGTSSHNWVIETGASGTRTLFFYVFFTGGTTSYTSPALTDETWHHIAMTVNGNEVKYYINGELKQTDNQTGTLVNNTTTAFLIGSRTAAGSSFANVTVDELLLTTEILTDQEVKDLYGGCYLHQIFPYSDTALEDVRFDYKKAKDCLDALAKASGSKYYWTPTGALMFIEDSTEDSAIDYDNSDVTAEPNALASLIPIKNKVYVIGGIRKSTDQSQTTTDSHVHTSDYWYAQAFTPTRNTLTQIQLYLQKIGSPTSNLEGGIYTSNGTIPSTTQLAGFSFDSELVSTTAGWVPATVNASLIVGEVYWIVLKKTGSAGNDYAWYHDNLATGSHAYDTDGSSFTLVLSSYELAFKTQYDTRTIAAKEDGSQVDTYEWREAVFRDESLVDAATANAYAEKKLTELTDETVELSDITIIDPDAVPPESTYVGVSFEDIDVTDDYDVKHVSLSWKAGQAGCRRMTLTIGRHADRLAEFLADLKLDVDRLKTSDLGEGTTVDTLKAITDSCSLTVADGIDTTISTRTDYITEDFDDLDDWGTTSGHYVTGGYMIVSHTTSETHKDLWHDTISLPDNYSLEFSFCTASWDNETTRHAVRFRVNDTDNRAYYEIATCAYYDYVGIVRVDNWAWEYVVLIYSDPYPFTRGVVYTCRIVQANNGAGWDCDVYIDGYLVTEYHEDTRAANLGDRISLHTYNYAYGGSHLYGHLYVWTEA